VNDIEGRLRDAYLGATQTVRPDSIRRLNEQAVTITWPPRGRIAQPRRYWTAALAAAAAIAVVGAAVATALPRTSARAPRHAASGLREGFLGAVSVSNRKIFIINATSGLTVGSVAAPGRSAVFDRAASGNGVTYVALTIRAGNYGSECGGGTLAKFTISPSGRPGPLTPLTGFPVSQLSIFRLAVSADDSTIAFTATRCMGIFGVAPRIEVINLITKRITQWSIPAQLLGYPITLTQDGHLLVFSDGAISLYSSAVYLLPTNAAPGAAIARSRVALRAAQVGRKITIGYSWITPDGKAMYISTRVGVLATTWQLRRVDLATGRIKKLGTYQNVGGPIEDFAVDPLVRRAIAIYGALRRRDYPAMLDLRTGQVRPLNPARWHFPNNGYVW
jgi:hypothetical protein